MLVEIKDAKEFESCISVPQLVLVHFSAKWAEHCTQMNAFLEELSNQKQYDEKSVKFYKCEAEDLSEVSLKYGIKAAPTIIIFEHGKVVKQIDGADTLKVNTALTELCGKSKASLEERLKKLINQHKIMIFIKGNRDQPRCGFSRQLISIINDVGVEYETFDVLSDEEVRQGLKMYWPTYPQVYVKGTFIGGLDIIDEMRTTGDLVPTLKD